MSYLNWHREAIVLRDVDDQVVESTREFTRVFGYTSEEAVGRLFMELIAPDELRDEAKRYGYLLEHGQRLEAETIRHRKGRHPFARFFCRGAGLGSRWTDCNLRDLSRHYRAQTGRSGLARGLRRRT